MAKKKKPFNKNKSTESIEKYVKHTKQCIHEMMDALTLNPEQPDYTQHIKRLIKESLAKRNDKDCLAQIDFDVHERFKTDNIYQKRRQAALLEYLPILAKKFRPAHPDAPIERIIMDMTMVPTSALPDTMFIHNDVSNSDILTLGVAIYILDDLKQNGNILEALIYMPNSKTELDTIELPDENFSDAVFPNDVIKSMMFLIENRDGEKDVYLNHTTATRTKDNIAPIQYTSFEKTKGFDSEDEYGIIVDKHDEAIKMSYRERMDKILSLMSPEKVSRAEKRFEEKLYALIDITLSLCEQTWRDILDSYKKISSASFELADVDKRMKSFEKKPNNNLPNAHQIINACMLLNDPKSMAENNADNFFSTMDSFDSSRDRLYRQIIKEHEILNRMQRKYSHIIYCVENGHNHKFTYDNDVEIIDKMKNFSVDNPYEMVFAYFHLLDRGNNLVWLVEPAATLLDITAYNLPWILSYSDKLVETINAICDSPVETTNKQSDTNDYLTLEKKLYQKRYTDDIEWALCGIKDVPREHLQKLSIAQIVYRTSNTILPRDVSIYKSDIHNALVKCGFSKKNTPLLQLFLETNSFLSMKHNYTLYPEDTEVDSDIECSEDISMLQKTLSEKTKQIAELRSALHDAERKAKREQENAQHIANDALHEHNELVQLRELVYKMQNNTDDNDSTAQIHQIELPYTTRQNIVIFGGHATWLKAIRPMLPNVRFIEPRENPDVNMIRNADVVWMQSNAMPHSFYGKIMDIARQRKIPVKYFAYASAEKCAYQLIEDDYTSNCH